MHRLIEVAFMAGVLLGAMMGTLTLEKFLGDDIEAGVIVREGIVYTVTPMKKEGGK